MHQSDTDPKALCNRLQQLVGMHPDYFYLFDEEHRFTYVSPALLKLWGLSSDEALGKNFEELEYPPELVELHREQLRRAFDGEIVRGENAYVSPAGEKGYYEYIFTPVYKDGVINSVAGVTRDITHRRQCELEAELLAEAGARLAESLKQSEVMRAAARSAIPTLGDVCVVAVGEDDITEVEAAGADDNQERDAIAFVRSGRAGFEAVLQNGDIHRAAGEASDETSGGAIEEAPMLVVPLIVKRETIGALGVWRLEEQRPYRDLDVQVAKRLAKRVALAIQNARLYERAEDEVRLREDVLAVVSHDLRTPLSAIDLGVTSLERNSAYDDMPVLQRSLGVFRRSVDIMGRMICDLMDMSRLRTGSFNVQLEPCRLDEALNEAVDLHRPRVAEHQQRLGVSIEDPLDTCCDKDRIVQAVSNLLGNAVKFSPANGLIQVKAWKDDARIIIEIADEGPGIAEEKLGRIFDPYWTDDAKKGTGLGLYIAHGIVRSHGGTLSVKNSADGGALFRIELPRAS